MIFELATDFRDAVAAMPSQHSKRRMLMLLEEAIRRDVYFIDRHPTTLFQCMWNCCWWYDHPSAATHYQTPDGGWQKLNAPWLYKGLKLCELLEAWRDAKQLVHVDFPWFRSLRPPVMHLESAQMAILRGHELHVTSAAFSPDGRRIVSCSQDATIRIWDSNTFKVVFIISVNEGEQGEEFYGAIFSPDSLLALGMISFMVRYDII